MGNFKSDGMMIFGIFIGVIITAVLIGTIGDSIFDQTNTREVLNVSVTTPAAQNTSVELLGRTLVGTMNLENLTGDDVSQFFIRDTRLGTDGLLHVTITSNGTSGVGNTLGQAVNTSYVYEPIGHAVNASDSNMIRLILIFAALAILIFAITMLFKSESMQDLLRR